MNDHKRGNISKCFPFIPAAASQHILQIPCFKYRHTVWARNGIRSCPLLHADSSGVGGVTPAHHSSAENRARSPKSLSYGTVSCHCSSPYKSVDSLLPSQTRIGFHGVAPIRCKMSCPSSEIYFPYKLRNSIATNLINICWHILRSHTLSF